MSPLCDSLKSLVVRLGTIRTQHLNLVKPLGSLEEMTKFENDLIDAGHDLFANKFFQVGCTASARGLSSFGKSQLGGDRELETLVASAQSLIVDTERWLHRFLASYPDQVIRLDEHETLEKDVCQVRSGLQFMLDLFRGSGNAALDDTLKFISDETVDYFDDRIRRAKESIAFRVDQEEVPDSLPRSHTWWFP